MAHGLPRPPSGRVRRRRRLLRGGDLIVPERYQSELRFDGPLEAAERKARAIDVEMAVRTGTLAGAVVLGRHRWQRPTIRLLSHMRTGNLGCGSMRDLRLTVDVANRRVRLEG